MDGGDSMFIDLYIYIYYIYIDFIQELLVMSSDVE